MEKLAHLMNETPNEIIWGLACRNSERSGSNNFGIIPRDVFVFSLFFSRGFILWSYLIDTEELENNYI